MTNGGAISTISADLNNDGKFEFISVAPADGGLPHFKIFEWNGTNFISYDVLSANVVGSRQSRFGGDLSVADIDGDGWPDIVVPESNNGPGTGKVSWFKNPGTLGGQWLEVVISTWSGSGIGNIAEHMADIAVGDINGDGKMDVVTRDVSHGFWVMIQIANGTSWQPRKFVPANPREGLALWDPDNDGDLDVLLNGIWFETPSDPVNGTYLPRPINGAAAWYPTNTTSITINDYACQVEVGDFNGDGKMDFVISNAEKLQNDPSTSSKPLGVRVYLAPNNVINDPWTEIVLHTNYFNWHNCEVGDLDLDGKLDIISGIALVGVISGPGQIIAFLNNGSGTAFAPQIIASGADEFGTNYNMYNASIGDADGDGDLDLFAPNNWNNGSLRYFQNTMVAPSPLNSLKIVRSNSNMVISWPSSLAGTTLQTTTNVLSSGWVNHNGPFTTNNQTISVIENIGSTNRYFRLNSNP